MIEIPPLASPAEAERCAAMMCSTEPWITLKRSYDDSLKILTDPTREVYVAHDGDAIRGFLILNMRGAFVGYIQTVCVAADARGGGVGSQLVAFGEERIFKESPNVFLCVSSFNPRARALYERLGYETIGELRDYLVRGASEILMRKTRGPIAEFRAPPSSRA
jgi:ribosomal-protein-alanine N-acetyltransferase